MISKQLQEINIGDIQYLFDNKIPESRTIEYKAELPDDTDVSKKEFLADISSFANSIGGDLIYGIKAVDGIPVAIDGVQIDNQDAALLKYDSLIRDGLEPRIKYNTRLINKYNDTYFLIFRIEKSWSSPHRVIYKSHDKFYGRASNGKYPLDTYELREAFYSSGNLNERIKDYVKQRIESVSIDDVAFKLNDGGKILFHIIPFDAIINNERFDILKVGNLNQQLRPIYPNGWNNRINLDGYLTYSLKDSPQSVSYTQLYRNGIVESIDEAMLIPFNGQNVFSIYSSTIEEEIINATGAYFEVLKRLELQPPFAISLNLLNIKDYVLKTEVVTPWRIFKYDRYLLQCPVVLLNNYNEII